MTATVVVNENSSVAHEGAAATASVPHLSGSVSNTAGGGPKAAATAMGSAAAPMLAKGEGVTGARVRAGAGGGASAVVEAGNLNIWAEGARLSRLVTLL